MDPRAAWLQKLGLERYSQLFSDSEVDFASVRLLTDQDLREIGVPLGPRKRLRQAIDELYSGTPGADCVPQN